MSRSRHARITRPAGGAVPASGAATTQRRLGSQANETARPWGRDGPTPQECWDSSDADHGRGTVSLSEDRAAAGTRGAV